MASARILIEGKTVQQVGYRIFLLEKALENGIERIYARNLDKNKVELLLTDEEHKINKFYEVIKSERPEGAVVEDVKKEPYDGKIPIPSIDRYLQFLTLEQLTKGREEVVKLPAFVGNAIQTVASALKGIDEKFGTVAQRFGVFGDYAKRMDEKLTGMNEKLDTLPERIAEALTSSKKKSRP